MAFAGINFIAVLVAAVAAWLASAVWYMSLGPIYQAALGKTPEQCKEEMKKPGAFLPFLYAFIGNLVIAWMLAGVLGHLGQVTLQNGVITGGVFVVRFHPHHHGGEFLLLRPRQAAAADRSRQLADRAGADGRGRSDGWA